MRKFLERIQIEWEDFCWKYSTERRELASARLREHEQAMREGKPSPYTIK